MYKDKDKQREANREANKRYRERQEARESCVIPDGRDTLPVIPSDVIPEYPRVSDQDFTKLMAQAGPDHVRVSKPGDADYEPQCETTLLVNAELNTGDKRLKDYYDKHREITKPKRGKDIKCFEDLPPGEIL